MLTRLCALTSVLLLQTTSGLQRADFRTEPVTTRIETLWLVTYRDPAGNEGIAEAPTIRGDTAPLMAADQARLKNIIEAGRAVAKTHNVTLHLVRLSHRTDLEEFLP